MSLFPKRRPSTFARAGLASAAGVAAALLLASAASAAGTITGAAVSTFDVVEDRPFAVVVTGAVDAADVDWLGSFVTVNAPGRGCAPTYAANRPNIATENFDFVPGAAISLGHTLTVAEPGLYAVCSYLDDMYDKGSRPIAKGPDGMIAVRTPTVALTLGLPAARFEPGATTQLSWTASVEAERGVSVEVVGARRTCGPTAYANDGIGPEWLDVKKLSGGPFHDLATVQVPTRKGSYRLCGYVHEYDMTDRPSLVSGDVVFGVGQQPTLTEIGPENILSDAATVCRTDRPVLARGKRIPVACTGDLGTIRIRATRPGFSRARSLTLDDGRASFRTTRRFPRGRYALRITEQGMPIGTVRVRLT